MIGLPKVAYDVGMMQPEQPAAPFVWGAGGVRLTPEEILARQSIAQDQMRSDYSPVQHWSQGLGRVADNVLGALESKRLGKAQTANAAESDAVLRALMGGDKAATTAALTNRYVSDDVKGFAGKVWDRQNPKAQAPTDFQQMLMAGGVQPGSPEYAAQNLARAQSLSDPLVTVSLPDGGIFNGPASQLAAVLKGGGQASGSSGVTPAIPTAPVGKLTPIGGQMQPASGNFP